MELEQYLDLHPKKYLIFDVDRTLAFLRIDWSLFRRSLWDTVATFDIPLTKEVPFEPWKGIELANKAILRHGKHAVEILTAFNGAYELAHYGGYVPNPGLLAFIRSKPGYKLYLWTNNQGPTIKPFLENEQLSDSFAGIVSREMVDFIKPYPDGFAHIYIAGTDKKDYLMIGDSVFDKEASERAGIDFFRIDYFDR